MKVLSASVAWRAGRKQRESVDITTELDLRIRGHDLLLRWCTWSWLRILICLFVGIKAIQLILGLGLVLGGSRHGCDNGVLCAIDSGEPA